MSDDLVKRLRERRTAFDDPSGKLINPDGPEAADRIERMEKALRYARPIIERYGHTQGNSEAYHAELIAPIDAALSEAPETTNPAGR